MAQLKRRKGTLRPAVEAMEERALLSGTVGAMATPSMSEVKQLQSLASSEHLATFLSGIAVAETNRGDVQQYAQQVLQAGLQADNQLHMAANQLNVILPTSISQPTDQATARQVLAAVGTSNFDQLYLSTIMNVEQQLSQSVQSIYTNFSGQPALNGIQPQIASAGQLATQAQTVMNGLSSASTVSLTIGTGTQTPANDAEFLQWGYTYNNEVILLSQAMALDSPTLPVDLYALKLVGDHMHAQDQAFELAAYAGLTPSAMPTPLQYAVERQFLAALAQAPNASQGQATSLNAHYLNSSVAIHQNALGVISQELGRTQDPNVHAFAQGAAATTYMHEISAQRLLNQLYGGGNNTSGNPFAPLVSGINPRLISNVQQRISTPRGGRRLGYTVSFNSGGYRYTQTYNMNVAGRGTQASITEQQALDLFLYLAYNSLYGTGPSPGSTVAPGAPAPGAPIAMALHHRHR